MSSPTTPSPYLAPNGAVLSRPLPVYDDPLGPIIGVALSIVLSLPLWALVVWTGYLIAT